MPHGKVLLAALPFAPPSYPSLALGLLKPAVAALGVGCDIRYFSLDYLEQVGAEAFEFLADTDYYGALVGEWVFAGAAHGASEAEDLRYLAEVFRRDFPEHYTPQRLMTFLSARQEAASFIERCVAAVDWRDYAIVGLTSSFQQNLASLALARRVKQLFPHLLVVFGGANCQGEMGVELHRRYEFIDAVCLGEADRAFPELVRRHLAGAPLDGIPGVVTRRDGATVEPAQALDAVEDMDSLPYPDLADFYAQHAASPVATAHYPTAVVLETSRGCWWGAKHHCTFCGINGLAMAYRSKSPARAYDELSWLAARHGSDLVSADTILDMRYFEGFLPRLAADGPDITMYFQMKANLRADQLTLLSRAGIKKIQPGIESLSTRILGLMDKGCSALQNVQVLKLAAEAGLYVEWNLLYGFPGETDADYAAIAAFMPKLRHLQPPGSLGRARADRFSPYFSRPGSFGVRLAPAPAYRFIYPFDEAGIRRLAYHFEMESDGLAGLDRRIEATAGEYAAWREHHAASALAAEDAGDAVVVTDARWGWPSASATYVGIEAAILRLCWQITPLRVIVGTLRPAYGEAAVNVALAALEARGLLLHEDGLYLGLPLRQPGFRRAPRWAEIRAAEIVPFALRMAAEVAASTA